MNGSYSSYQLIRAKMIQLNVCFYLYVRIMNVIGVSIIWKEMHFSKCTPKQTILGGEWWNPNTTQLPGLWCHQEAYK